MKQEKKKIFLITRYKRVLRSSEGKLEESIIKLLSRYRGQEKKIFPITHTPKNTSHKLFIRERVVIRFKSQPNLENSGKEN